MREEKIKMICDRCGYQTETHSRAFQTIELAGFIAIQKTETSYSNIRKDLCNQCCFELSKFLTKEGGY